MPIEPDGKDWTWVLERGCPECGFDASTFPKERVAALVRRNAQDWVTVLDAPAALLRRPTADDRWSILEYACHVRDVFRLYDLRLHLMLAEDNPTFPNWDQDQSALDDRYNEQDPVAVGAGLLTAAAEVAARFDLVTGDQWNRGGRRGDGAEFTVDTFSRYMVHDPVHHLCDVTGLASNGEVRSTGST